MKQSFHDIAFIQELKRRFDTDVITEYRFCPKRRWKCDFYLPKFSLIIEKEGGIWTHGRHTRSVGFLNDIEKYNELTVRGYWLIRVTPQTINKTETFDLIQRHINRNIEIPF